MTEKLNDNTLPLTPIQTDRIDCSPPMDLSPDVTQMHVESPTKNLTPNILTHASADSPPMDLSLDIFLFLDDIDRVDVTDNGQENDVVQDGHKTTSDRPIDKDMTNSPDLSAFFLGREKCVTNKTHKKNNRKYRSKLVSGKAITEENVIAYIQEHCESKKRVKKGTKKSSSKIINKQEKVKGSAMKKKVNGKQKGKASTNVSPKPGTSGLQTIYLSDSEFEDSLYDHESQMSQSELCCVCNKFYPEKLKECGDLTIANWGQCMFEGCLH
jgi:hypothetical protein